MTSRVISEYFHVLSPRPRRHLASTKINKTPLNDIFSHPDLSVITEILSGKLYLSGCEVVTPSNLIARGITAVVCAMTTWEAQRVEMDGRTPLSVKVYRVAVLDSETTDISVYFDPVTRFISDELRTGGKVLVHCVAGISRSVSLILAYLINQGYTLLDAFNHVAEKRKIAWPNDGFYRQLIRYDRNLRDKKRALTSDSAYRPLTSLSTATRRYSPRSPALGRRSYLL